MRTCWLAGVVLLGLVIGYVALADDEYDQLLEQFEEAQDQWFEELAESQEDAKESTKPSEPPPHPAEKFLGRFRRYAKKRAGQPEAIPALVWIITQATPDPDTDESGKPSAAETALDRLTQDHAGQLAVKEVLPELRWVFYMLGKDQLVAFYEQIIATNKDQDAVAGAYFNLAMTLYQTSRSEEQGAESGQADRRRAKKLFHKIAKEHPQGDLAEDAKAYIFEMDHLQVGMVAPDLAGPGPDGQEIKLSQFRGQVVVLDFWGFW
jgi:tetratricopeptide (TPR) repeat protein